VNEPEWLSLDIVLDAHAEILARFGGKDGLRDASLLESALARPENKFRYGERDLAALAAAYAYGLARDHAFVDGNKRVALAALIMFLGLNGFDFVAPEPEATAMMLALAASQAGEDLLAHWIRQHWRKSD
jgi:death-on-curing protein